MARGQGRGGYRKPANPAPAGTSLPGAGSSRTDGGPADVPVYASPAGERPYGERKKVEAMASAAPIGEGGAPAGRGPDPAVNNVLAEGVFSPTRHPDEPLTAGVDVGPGPGRPVPVLPEDPNMVLRALIAQGYDHPDIVRLLNG